MSLRESCKRLWTRRENNKGRSIHFKYKVMSKIIDPFIIKKEILSFMDENGLEVSEKYGISEDDVYLISNDLESKGLISFTIVNVCLSDDNFVMAWYYSEKLAKTIVLDQDVGNFDDVVELVSGLVHLEMEVKDIERVLPDISPVARLKVVYSYNSFILWRKK